MLLLWPPPDEVSDPRPDFLLFLEYLYLEELWILTFVVRASNDWESQLPSRDFGGSVFKRGLYEWLDTTLDLEDKLLDLTADVLMVIP